MTLATPVRTGFIVGLGIAAAALYIFHLAAAIFTERVLAVDGANFLLSMLSQDYPWPLMDDPKHLRLVANVLNQFPAALAINAGVEDLRVLKLLFGAGSFLVPVALSLVCLWLCRRARDYRLMVFLLASLITATLPSEQFKVNPAFTAAALCWIPLAYATLRLKATIVDQAFVVLVLIALFRSHEGVAFWGPVLAAAAIWRLFQCEQHRPTWETWHLHAIAAAGVALPPFVVFWQLTHPVAEQTGAFFAGLPAMLPGEMWRGTGASRISLVVAVAFGATLLALAVPALRQRLQHGFTWRNPAYLALFAIVLASAALALHVALRFIAEPWHVGTYMEYEYRILIPFGTALWMALAILMQRLDFTFAPIGRTVGFVLATGLAAASLWQLWTTKLWHDAQRAVAHVIDHSEKTLIPLYDVEQRFDEIGAPWLREPHRSGWHWGGYSIAVQNKRRIERFVSHVDMEFRVEPHPASHWPLRLSFVTFNRNGYFDFDTFLAGYADSPGRQRVEREHTLWHELETIRTIADGRAILEPADSVDINQGIYYLVLRRALVRRAGPGRSSVPADSYLILSHTPSRTSLTPTHSIVFLYEPQDLALLHLEELEAINAAEPIAQFQFNVYWLDGGKRLAWLREHCEYADTEPAFLLHLHPVNTTDLPQDRRHHGFDNRDFRFQYAGGRLVDGRCWVIATMPAYPITSVTTGQYDGDGVIWKAHLPPGGGFLDETARPRASASQDLEAITATEPMARSQFNVYWLDGGKRLAYLREPCEYADTEPRFLLHLHPVNTMDLPQDRRQHGFNNRDFRFQQAGGRVIDGRCWAIAEMPGYPIAGVTTGQYDEDGVIWKAHLPYPGLD